MDISGFANNPLNYVNVDSLTPKTNDPNREEPSKEEATDAENTLESKEKNIAVSQLDPKEIHP